MNPFYAAVVVYWLAAAFVGIFFTIRKVVNALTMVSASEAEQLNAAQRYQARWRMRSAWEALGVAIAFGAAPVTNILGLPAWVSIIALSIGLTLFVIKQVDDDRSHDALSDMLMTDPNAPTHRHMDEEPLSS